MNKGSFQAGRVGASSAARASKKTVLDIARITLLE